jgi:hypothetical protein
MKVIWNRYCKWVFKDRPRLLKIDPVNPKIALSLGIIPLENL